MLSEFMEIDNTALNSSMKVTNLALQILFRSSGVSDEYVLF